MRPHRPSAGSVASSVGSRIPSPKMLMRCASLFGLMLAALTGCGTGGSGSSGNGVIAAADVGIFPSSAPWYQDVSQAGLDPKSQDVIDGLAAAGGWGNGNVMQIDSSIEVLSADAGVARRAFMPTGDFYDPDCDHVDVPVPSGGRLEGESD